MGERRVVIITGMHRSGTSLTASILERAGVHVGSQLVPANYANPRGYFEDVEFLAFHESVLRSFGQTWLVQDAVALGEIDPKDVRRAEELIKTRQDITLWGWKDPRTCHFLDFWHCLLPDARFVFVYRHPVEVTLSLLRRSARVDVEAIACPIASFRSWCAHNELLLGFYRRHSNACFLAHIHAVASEPDGFVQRVSDKLGLSLRPEEAPDVYAKGKLQRMAFPDDVLIALERLLPEAMSLYGELESIADLPQARLPDPGHSLDASRTGDGKRPRDEDALARELSLLVMKLAPKTFLASRVSLDDMRIESIAELEEELRAMQSTLSEHFDLRFHAKALARKLAAIEGSRAWRAVTKWYTLKRKLSRASDWIRVRKLVAENDARVARTETSSRQGHASTPSKAVLFISHDARPHGAQFLLLNFLRWLGKHTDIRFEVLLQEGGPLKEQFEALAPVSIWHDVVNGRLTHPKESDRLASAMKFLARAEIGLIYSNTLASGEILYLLSKAGLPMICHAHELSYFMTYRVKPFFRREMRRCVDRFIAASQAVKESLIQTMRVPSDRVSVVHEFISTQVGPDTPPEKIKRSFSIPENARVVGGSGTTDWRKGPDLFVELARAIQKRRLPEPVHFVWIGGANEGPAFGALWHDVVHAGIEDRVHFLGHRENATSYVAAFDVFALTSREDPYPLVCLEAAACSKPIVCFDGSGGAREFVEDDCGFVVPYLDVEAMADRVAELLESPELRSGMGQRAQDKVRERHDVSVAAPKIVKIIESLLDRDRGPVQREKEDSAR